MGPAQRCDMSKEALGIKDDSEEQVLWKFKIATITKAPYWSNKQGSSHNNSQETTSNQFPPELIALQKIFMLI